MLEVLIFGKRIFQGIDEKAAGNTTITSQQEYLSRLKMKTALDKAPLLSLQALQNLLWDNVGIVRDRQGLTEAVDILGSWQHTLPQPSDRQSHELANMIVTGRLIAEAALLREESRGAHFRSDFPQRSPEWLRHIVTTIDKAEQCNV